MSIIDQSIRSVKTKNKRKRMNALMIILADGRDFVRAFTRSNDHVEEKKY